MPDNTKPDDAVEALLSTAEDDCGCRIPAPFREVAEHAVRLATSPTPAPVGITMQDVRLIAGEGKLSAQTVLDAVNAMLRQRSGAPVAIQEDDVERVAKALCLPTAGAWEKQSVEGMRWWRELAVGAIAALGASSPVGEGRRSRMTSPDDREVTLSFRCTEIADRAVPEYRAADARHSGCGSHTAKRWQAAWDAACIALGGNLAEYRR